MTILRIKPREDGTCPVPVCSGTLPPVNWDQHVKWHQIAADLRSVQRMLDEMLTDHSDQPEHAEWCFTCHLMSIRSASHEHKP